MSEYHEVQFSLALNADVTYGEIRKLEITLIRILGYIQRFSGDERIDKAVMKVEKLIMTIRYAQIAIRAFEIAEGPIGWIYALTTGVAMLIHTADTVNDFRGG